MGMILRIASSRIVGQGDIVGRSGYFSLNLSANSVMRGRLDARRTLKSLVADLRTDNNMDEKKMTGLLIGMQKSLFNFAYSLTMNRDDAQDLLQATSLKVLSNVEKLVHYENLNGWMYTIMRNIFINDYHRNVNRRTVYDNEDETIMKSVANGPSDDTPESLYNVKEINKAIDNLSKEYRVPFSLYLAGYKYQEIADEMHLPIGTIKSRIYMTRQQLQSRLRDYHYER